MAYRLNRLGKSFLSGQRTLRVLSGLSAEFPESGSVAIQGASGCGKTTLLNLMAGLDRPSEGEVFWKDVNIAGMSRGEAAEWRNRKLGFVFQRYHLMPQLTALENVRIPAWLGRREGTERARELLEQVGLAERMEHLPKELSGGEQQRVAIARALMNDPGIILADEPTGNLDARTGREVLNLLLDLTAQTQKALILVTHDNEIAKQLSRCYCLRDGHLEV